MTPNNQIKNIFENQTIFLTGATGFLGKVLLEKLLRECGGLKRIYILIRPKKGKTTDERYQEIFDQACFAPIKSKNVNVKAKVFLVGGDCNLPLLGLDNHDLEILKEETNFVIHMAANVRFDQSLKQAALNVQATRDLLEISKQMANLKAFMFVSTAYSNCIHSRIKEQIYDPPVKCDFLLNLVEECDDNILEKITPHLLGKWPNTYVYTKSISEGLVATTSEFFPTAIVRPGIVMNAVEEPIEGWIDNLYGPIGILVGAAHGIIRTCPAKKDVITAIVPVDYVCNCVLAATWRTAKDRFPKTEIYNYIRHSNKFIKWGELVDTVTSTYWTYAPDMMVWYNTFTIRENKLWHYICTFLLHTIPAYLTDGVLWCLNKPRIAVKGYQKIDKTLSLMSYFSYRTWTFDDDNVTNLWNQMEVEDRRLFRFRNERLEWIDYIHGCLKGMKRFFVNEPVKTTFGKRVKLSIFFVLNYVVILLFWYFVFKFFVSVLSMFF